MSDVVRVFVPRLEKRERERERERESLLSSALNAGSLTIGKSNLDFSLFHVLALDKNAPGLTSS